MQKIDLNGKTILVTGGAGFIGSNLIKRLFTDVEDATIVNIDNMNARDQGDRNFYTQYIPSYFLKQIA